MLSSPARSPRTLSQPVRPYVLLVDDHRPTLHMLQEVVALEGHACVSAASACEAICACDERPPQVVVTDLAMPNLDGSGLARWLRARYPSLPLILVTGELLDAPTRASLDGMFSAIYTKPVNIPSLLERLARVMPPVPNRQWQTARP